MSPAGRRPDYVECLSTPLHPHNSTFCLHTGLSPVHTPEKQAAGGWRLTRAHIHTTTTHIPSLGEITKCTHTSLSVEEGGTGGVCGVHLSQLATLGCCGEGCLHLLPPPVPQRGRPPPRPPKGPHYPSRLPPPSAFTRLASHPPSSTCPSLSSTSGTTVVTHLLTRHLAGHAPARRREEGTPTSLSSTSQPASQPAKSGGWALLPHRPRITPLGSHRVGRGGGPPMVTVAAPLAV